MSDEIRRQTPIPVPHVYGQPPSASPTRQPATTDPAVPGVTFPTVEQPASFDTASGPATATTIATFAPVVGAPAPSTEQAPSPAPIATAPTSTSNAPSPAGTIVAPARTGTPTPLRTMANGQDKDNSSRAASQHPDPGFTMPAEAPPHGAGVRQYLNAKVVGPLLDGMKMIGQEQPRDPLRVLGEYLIQRSKEIESSSSSS
ncbi:hypothetical protein GGR54DRAFT_635838 [Hypoxylon sp. NC1633]|nr:hypothetical protein GGR54DRAFT_635838 [Hypoxylon sp. NC1633]